MSTRSYIGYIDNYSKVHLAYCHFDGYLEGVGSTLINFYNNKEKAIMLVKGGDMSSVGERRAEYYKDEAGPSVIDLYEIDKVLTDSWAEYCYLYDTMTNRWFWKDCYDGWGGAADWKPLADEFDIQVKYIKKRRNQ